MVKCFVISFLVLGLALIGSGGKIRQEWGISVAQAETSETEIELPWNFGGYTKLDEFHLRYYYVHGEAIERVLTGEMSWEESIKDNTGIVEVWFKSRGSLFRLDRYIEKLGVICESYEGAPPDTTSYNGKTYSLFERRIQKGLQKTHYGFAYRVQTGYDEQTKQAIGEGCHYEKSASKAAKERDQKSALPLGALYSSSGSEDKELEISGLELDELMNPVRYKKIVEAWKVKQTIAGRTAIKHYWSPAPARFVLITEGFQFIDADLGIGLAGYLEGCRQHVGYKEIRFEEPKLVFKALLVETTVSSDAFEGH